MVAGRFSSSPGEREGSSLTPVRLPVSGGETRDQSEADPQRLPHQAHSENNKVPVAAQGKKLGAWVQPGEVSPQTGAMGMALGSATVLQAGKRLVAPSACCLKSLHGPVSALKVACYWSFFL